MSGETIIICCLILSISGCQGAVMVSEVQAKAKIEAVNVQRDMLLIGHSSCKGASK